MEQNNIITKENVTINDFKRICRTCLSTVDLHLISDVFNLGYFPVELALNKYTQIQFDHSDILPKLICSNCVSSLNNSYYFLLNCDLINTTLKDCLAQYESSLQTNICLPNEIEYVNCHIKQECDLSEPKVKIDEYTDPVKLPHLKIEGLHTNVDIKEETPYKSLDLKDDLDDEDVSEDENDSDNNCDYADREQITANVKHKSRHEGETQFDPKRYSHSIPEISKEKYEAAYNSFIEWHRKQKHKSFSQKVLLAYFRKLEKFKASTLWTIYSKLRTTLNIYKNVEIARYAKLRAFLKVKSDGYLPKKSKIFNAEEMNKFIREAPDDEYLLTKVVLIMGVFGACRRDELYNIKLIDLLDLDSAVLVKITKLKTSREFTITGHFYEVVKRYVDLRPKEHPYFFLNYQKGKCHGQKVGINKFGKMGKQIATYLKLPNPELYTGLCFRRTSLKA